MVCDSFVIAEHLAVTIYAFNHTYPLTLFDEYGLGGVVMAVLGYHLAIKTPFHLACNRWWRLHKDLLDHT